ncbi:MAG: hypothetical protein E7678_04855 [Ruminococcaceae bacterium]|nr:hypothetical protein [Oscillospiraceae bacterium]
MVRKKYENGENAIVEGLNGKKVNNEKRAVMAREEPSCDRSFVMVPEELRRLYPNVKEEFIERALEDFGKYKFDDGESVIQAFSKVLAAVIIDETIGKRGRGE